MIFDIATNDPEIKSKTDNGKVTYCPIFGNFSQIITRVAKAINPMFITPPTKARSINIQQHPKQLNPSRKPILKDCRCPWLQNSIKNASGARYC